MLRLIRNGVFAAALLALSAGAASAGPLVSAVLDLKFGSFKMASFPAVGATGTTTGSLDASLGAGTAFNGTFMDPSVPSQSPPVTKYTVFVTGNDALAWSNGPAPSAFYGAVKVGGLGGLTLLFVPLNLGSPFTFTKSAGGINLTATFASWTTSGTYTAISYTPSGLSSFTVMATGANNLTPGGAGTLVLVTPLVVQTNIAGTINAFGVLTLTYVPEPGTLLLLGAGVAALAALGRRKS